jgi:DNA repair protein SbcD/Mre11
MKFIHTGDHHLGLSLKSASFAKSDAYKKRMQEVQSAFFDLCEIVKTSPTDFMVLTGDLFDHARVKISLIEEVFYTLNRLNKPIYITIGNHDTFLHNAAFENIRQLENIHFFSSEQFKYTYKNVDIYGMNTKDYDEDRLTELTTNINPNQKNILCLHGDIFNAKDDHYLSSKAFLKKLPFDYIALGHIHKHEFIDTHIAYSGNLEPFDFSETEVKGYILGDLSEPTFTFIPYSKRRFVIKKITLTSDDTIHSIKQKLFEATTKKERDNDFIRVILEGRINRSLHLDDDAFLLIQDDYYYIEFKNQTKYDLDLEALKKAYKDTIIEYLIDSYHESESDEESLVLAIDALLETEEGSR